MAKGALERARKKYKPSEADTKKRIAELNDPTKSISEMSTTVKNTNKGNQLTRKVEEVKGKGSGNLASAGTGTSREERTAIQQKAQAERLARVQELKDEGKSGLVDPDVEVFGKENVGKSLEALSAIPGVGAAEAIGSKIAGKLTGKAAVKAVGNTDDLLRGRAGNKILKEIDRGQAIRKLQSNFKIDGKQAEKIMGMLDDLDKSALRKLFENKIVRWGVGAAGVTAVWKLIDTSSMMSWAAIDNLIGAGSFFTKGKADAVIFQGGDAQEALKDIDETEKTMQIGMKVLNETTRKNPFLKPYRDLLMGAANVSMENIQLQKDRIELAGGTQDE